jgi:hypothetical protein
MNAHATTGIRELTAQELNEVTGGWSRDTSYDAGAVFLTSSIAIAVVTGFATLWDWLFG